MKLCAKRLSAAIAPRCLPWESWETGTAIQHGDLYLKSALAGYLPGMLAVATAYQAGDYKEAYPIIVTQCFVNRFRATEAHSSD